MTDNITHGQEAVKLKIKLTSFPWAKTIPGTRSLFSSFLSQLPLTANNHPQHSFGKSKQEHENKAKYCTIGLAYF